MEGWIKLHRQIIDSPVFAHPIALKIWLWLLCKASYRDRTVQVSVGRGYSMVDLRVGQFVFGRHKAEEELGIDGSTIYKWMQKFQEEHNMITIDSSSKYSIVTILKFTEFQDDATPVGNNSVAAAEQLSNNSVAAVEQLSNTNNNYNNYNNDQNDKTVPPAPDENLNDKNVPREPVGFTPKSEREGSIEQHTIWTNDVIAGNDVDFIQLLRQRDMNLNGKLERYARDHLDLSVRYGWYKKQPIVLAFRFSLLKYIKEEIEKNEREATKGTNGSTGAKVTTDGSQYAAGLQRR